VAARDDLVFAQTPEGIRDGEARILAEEVVSGEEWIFLNQVSGQLPFGTPSQVSPESLATLPEPLRAAIAKAARIEARIEAAMPQARRRVRRRYVRAVAPRRSYAPVRRGPRQREHRAGRRSSSRAAPGDRPRSSGDDEADPHDLVLGVAA
jgi:hypothetical protein